jgi:hypothetical protein
MKEFDAIAMSGTVTNVDRGGLPVAAGHFCRSLNITS